MKMNILRAYTKVWLALSPYRRRLAAFKDALFAENPTDFLVALGMKVTKPIRYEPIVKTERDFHTVEIKTQDVIARNQALIPDQPFTHDRLRLEAEKSWRAALERPMKQRKEGEPEPEPVVISFDPFEKEPEAPEGVKTDDFEKLVQLWRTT